MALANCERCNGVFNRIGGPLCPTCVDQEEEDFRVVNDALREEPNQTIDQLAERTGVSEKTILGFVKSKRIASDVNVGEIKCGKCGAPAISLSVRLCERCSEEMAKAVGQARSDISKTGSATGTKAAAGEDDIAQDETVHETIQRKTGKS